MSLRLRLLAGLAALVVLGLGVFGTVTYLSVNRFLLSRLDSQLSDAARALAGTDAARLRIPGGGGPGGGPGPDGPEGTGSDETSARNAAGPELFVEFVHPDGSAFEPVRATRNPGGVAPQLAPVVAAMATEPGDRPQTRTFTTAAAEGGSSERVAVLPMNGGAIVVTASLQPIRVTLGHLLVVELAVGLGVLVLTGGLGLALARQATRPLEEIAATADAIAAGEMDRRVPAGRNGSETGRVARALNTMLTQIQDAFARRDATEARLRTFVADASHELSTPLTSIRGYAELFHRGLQDRPGAGGWVRAGRVIAVVVARQGRRHAPTDLLPRLSGRVVKGQWSCSLSCGAHSSSASSPGRPADTRRSTTRRTPSSAKMITRT